MIAGSTGLALAMGFAFGWLLQRGRLTDSNVIEGQFRLTDFTMVKVMLTAIVVGGLGVLFLIDAGDAKYYIKEADLLAVALGAALFGVSLVIWGYCPGTGLASAATGSVHGLIGDLGAVAGAIAYASTFDWVKAHILPVAAYGKTRIPDLTGVPDLVWFLALAVAALALFYWVERRDAGAA
jgi:uncharacterized protein